MQTRAVEVDLSHGRQWAAKNGCWLERHDTRHLGCAGRTDRAHLIPQQLLRREGLGALTADARLWVPACRLHHSHFDQYRGVVVPRRALPRALEALAAQLGLGWYLDRRFGER